MTCIAAQTYKLKSTNFLDLILSDADDVPINDATVEITLRAGEEEDAAAVSGAIWPITADYVAASDGKYRAVLSSDLVLTKNEIYFVHVLSTRLANDYDDYTVIPINT